MDLEKTIDLIVEDLQLTALPFNIYAYEIKATHQIIRKHLTEQLKLYGVVFNEVELKPLESDFTQSLNELGGNKVNNKPVKKRF